MQNRQRRPHSYRGCHRIGPFSSSTRSQVMFWRVMPPLAMEKQQKDGSEEAESPKWHVWVSCCRCRAPCPVRLSDCYEVLDSLCLAGGTGRRPWNFVGGEGFYGGPQAVFIKSGKNPRRWWTEALSPVLQERDRARKGPDRGRRENEFGHKLCLQVES